MARAVAMGIRGGPVIHRIVPRSESFMSEQAWELPPFNDRDFTYRVGTSLLSEFALGHSPADVLRELVQNEYDAGGRSLEVVFGADALTVHGYGAVIDSRGWQRLSVMLGTGVD